MAIAIGAGLGLDFGGITRGLNEIRAALSGIFGVAGRGMGAARPVSLRPIISDITELKTRLSEMVALKPAALGAFAPLAGVQYGMPGGPGRYGAAREAILMKGMEQMRAAFQAAPTPASLNRFKTALMRLFVQFDGTGGLFDKHIYPALKQYYESLKRQVASTQLYNKKMGEVSTAQSAIAKQMKQAALSGLPIIGPMFQKIFQAQAQRAQWQQMLGAAGRAGVPPLGGLAKLGIPGGAALGGMLGKLGSALPIITGIAGAITGIGKAAWGASKGIASMGMRLMKMPFSLLRTIHSAFQSILFTLYMLQRVFKMLFDEPIKILREVQTATVLAGNSVKEYGQALGVVAALSLTYAIPIEQIATGYKEVAKSGFNAAESQTILAEATKFAGVFQADLASAIDQTIGIIKAFHLPVSEAVNITNALYNAVSNSRASIADLTTALGYASDAASAAGVSFQETLAVITMFRDANLRASRAGMAFRSGIANLQRAMGVAAGEAMGLDEAVEVLGIDWKALGDETINLEAVFEQFNKVVADGVNLQEKMAFRAVFGLRYYNRWIELFKGGVTAYRERMKVIQENAQLEEKSVAIANELAGTVTRLSNLWTVFRINVLEQIKDSFADLNTIWDQATSFLTRLGSSIGKIMKVSAIQPIVDFIKSAFDPEALQTFEDNIRGVVIEIGVQFSALLEEVRAWIAYMTGGEASEGFRGIVQLIGTAVRYAFLISRVLIQTFVRFIKEYQPDIMAFVQRVGDFLVKVFPSFFRTALKTMFSIAEIVGSIIMNVMSFVFMLMPIIEGIGKVVYYALWPLIKIIDGLTWLFEQVGLAAEKAIYETPEEGLKKIGTQLEDLRRQFEEGWSSTIGDLGRQAQEQMTQVTPQQPAQNIVAALLQSAGITPEGGFVAPEQRRAQESLAKTADTGERLAEAMLEVTESFRKGMDAVMGFTEEMERATDEGKQAAVVYNDGLGVA